MVDAERAAIISLRLEFDKRMASMTSLDGLEEQALDLLELRPELYVIWNLFFSIGAIEFELAREREIYEKCKDWRPCSRIQIPE